MEPIQTTIKPLSAFALTFTPSKAPKPPRKDAELREMQNYVHARLAPVWGGKQPLTKMLFGMRTNHLKTVEDWYYMKSICEDAERRGQSFAATFWGSLKTVDNSTSHSK